MDEAVRPGSHGSTTIAPKVLKNIAAKACLEIPQCVRHTSGLNKLTGREYPMVEVRSHNTAIDAGVHIAVQWPSAVAEVAALVRENIFTYLKELTGIPVIRVDVHVAAVVPMATGLNADPIPLSAHNVNSNPATEEVTAPNVGRDENLSIDLASEGNSAYGAIPTNRSSQ